MELSASEKLVLLGAIERFPIGGASNEYEMDKKDYLAAKAAIIAYLFRNEEGLGEESVRSILASVLNTTLPLVNQAEYKLRLSNGFIDDFSKVELLRQNNKSYDETLDLIRRYSELYSDTIKR